MSRFSDRRIATIVFTIAAYGACVVSSACPSASSTVRSNSSGESSGRWTHPVPGELQPDCVHFHQTISVSLRYCASATQSVAYRTHARARKRAHTYHTAVLPDCFVFMAIFQPTHRVQIASTAATRGLHKHTHQLNCVLVLFLWADRGSACVETHTAVALTWNRLVCATVCPCRMTPLKSSPSKRNGNPELPCVGNFSPVSEAIVGM